MTTTTTNLSRYFQRRTREDGSAYTSLTDDRPEWLYDAVRTAHDDELPNDWRYETASAIVASLGDYDLADLSDYMGELADGLVDVYTADLLAWLAADLGRTAYCDEAISSGLTAGNTDAGIEAMIRLGQYLAIERMAQILAEAIAAHDDDDEDASYECNVCRRIGNADDGISGDGDDCPADDCGGTVHRIEDES